MEVKQKNLDVFQFIIHSKNDAINVISRCIDCQFVRKAAVFTAKAVLYIIVNHRTGVKSFDFV